MAKEKVLMLSYFKVLRPDVIATTGRIDTQAVNNVYNSS